MSAPLAKTVMALPHTMFERHALVEHEAFAAPQAVGGRNPFEVAQDAAAQLINVFEPFRLEIGARLFATDAAGAEHRDLFPPIARKSARDEVRKFAERTRARIASALERADFDLLVVARVDDDDVRIRNERVPIFRFDGMRCWH
jgi:hypothetical protein